MSEVTSRVRRTSHKCRIEVSTSQKHAAEIYSKDKNTHWRDAIAKEMSSTDVAFNMLKTGQIAHVGFKKTSGHAMFHAMMDFTRKARWVIDRHRKPSPEGSTYYGVVSRKALE